MMCTGGDEAQGVPAHSHATGPTAATVDAAKRLRAVASVLQLSNACIEDAISFLHQVCRALVTACCMLSCCCYCMHQTSPLGYALLNL
jgi:hypothetical protein